MKSTSNILPVAEKLLYQITKLINLYHSEMKNALLKDTLGLDEINKLSTSACKNIPDLIKLHETVKQIVNKKEHNPKGKLISMIANDEDASLLLKSLMQKISNMQSV